MANNLPGGIKRVFVSTCVIFTFCVLFVFIIGSAVPGFAGAIDLKNIMTILLFSAVFAAANLLLHLERISMFLRVLLHYAATALGFYFVFILIAAKATGPSAVFVMLLFYTVIYAILMGVYQVIFRTLVHRRTQKKTEYERIYK